MLNSSERHLTIVPDNPEGQPGIDAVEQDIAPREMGHAAAKSEQRAQGIIDSVRTEPLPGADRLMAPPPRSMYDTEHRVPQNPHESGMIRRGLGRLASRAYRGIALAGAARSGRIHDIPTILESFEESKK